MKLIYCALQNLNSQHQVQSLKFYFYFDDYVENENSVLYLQCTNSLIHFKYLFHYDSV